MKFLKELNKLNSFLIGVLLSTSVIFMFLFMTEDKVIIDSVPVKEVEKVVIAKNVNCIENELYKFCPYKD
jgi:hypothetical protein